MRAHTVMQENKVKLCLSPKCAKTSSKVYAGDLKLLLNGFEDFEMLFGFLSLAFRVCPCVEGCDAV